MPNTKALGQVVSEKKIFEGFSYYKPMTGVANFDPRGMIGTIYIEVH